MKRILVLAAILAMSAAPLTIANAAPNCTTGIPCGNSCIAKGKVCTIKPPAPQCKTGVPCGNTCIAKGLKCHLRFH
jgi:hypothetical protein